MAPKFGRDADGDIPPCAIINNWKAVVEFELYKQLKFESEPWKGRKAPCACRYFEGKIPATHKCYKQVFIPLRKRIYYWFKNTFKCAFRT